MSHDLRGIFLCHAKVYCISKGDMIMKTKIGFNVHSCFSKMNDVNFSSDIINKYRHRAQMIVDNISSIPSDTLLADSEKKYDEIKERAYLKV